MDLPNQQSTLVASILQRRLVVQETSRLKSIVLEIHRFEIELELERDDCAGIEQSALGSDDGIRGHSGILRGEQNPSTRVGMSINRAS